METKEKRNMPTQFHTKRNNLYLFEFPEEFGIDSWLVTSVDYPKYRFDDNLNEGSWLPINVSLMDLIKPSTTEKIYNTFLLSNKLDFTCLLHNLDKEKNIIETIEILVNKVAFVNFGKSHDDDNNIKTITISLDINYAKIK